MYSLSSEEYFDVRFPSVEFDKSNWELIKEAKEEQSQLPWNSKIDKYIQHC